MRAKAHRRKATHSRKKKHVTRKKRGFRGWWSRLTGL